MDVREIEAKVAAYLGYNDIAEFSKFVCSHYFLHFFSLFGGERSKQIRKHGALEQIRDRHLAVGWEDEFPLANAEIGK